MPRTICKFTLAIVSFLLPACLFAKTISDSAEISGFAQAFLLNKPIPDATITVLETGQQTKTNEKGIFGPISYPVGQAATLIFSKPGYPTTQTETVIVDKQGLTGPYRQITFQVPPNYMFRLLKIAIGAKEDPNSCHVATTIIAFHKTLYDIPQGEAGASVVLQPKTNEAPFYFDLFHKGPFKGLTYPFRTGLTHTSEDGGVLFLNLPPRDQPYTISAQKAGRTFTTAKFICRKGAFINISPPRGPMANS